MSVEDPAEDSPWPSAQQQIRNARQYDWDIRHSVEEQRVQRRIELEEARADHRQNRKYDETEPKLESALRVYADSEFYGELAKEYYRAGVSRFLPRRSREKNWMSSEFDDRAKRRREIVSAARRLDDIDREGGFDSASIADHSRGQLPAGDNHFHRAWDQVLAADICLARHILRRRRTTRKHTLIRALTRYSVMAAWIAMSIWFVLQLEESEQQIAMLVPLLGIPGVVEYRAQHKNRFIERISSINSEFRDARRDLRRRLTGGLGYGLEECEFEREPSECALMDWLRDFR